MANEAERIRIRLAGGRPFGGRLVGQDTGVDLAVDKIGASGLPVVVLGDSDRLGVGELVPALGPPSGSGRASFGVVSRKGAPLEVAAPGFGFIQSDAAVNPGHSVGPLVNMAGEVGG